MNRMKASEIKPAREELLRQAEMRCMLCMRPCSFDQAVLDHSHSTGMIRGSIHRSCNGLLGRVENGAKRYNVDLAAFAQGLAMYIKLNIGILHPSVKTTEEKKALLKKRALRRKKELQ